MLCCRFGVANFYWGRHFLQECVSPHAPPLLCHCPCTVYFTAIWWKQILIFSIFLGLCYDCAGILPRTKESQWGISKWERICSQGHCHSTLRGEWSCKTGWFMYTVFLHWCEQTWLCQGSGWEWLYLWQTTRKEGNSSVCRQWNIEGTWLFCLGFIKQTAGRP